MKELSATEFAKKLGVSRWAVIKRCNDGSIKSKRIGTYFAIPASELQHWHAVDGKSKHGRRLIRNGKKK